MLHFLDLANLRERVTMRISGVVCRNAVSRRKWLVRTPPRARRCAAFCCHPLLKRGTCPGLTMSLYCVAASDVYKRAASKLQYLSASVSATCSNSVGSLTFFVCDERNLSLLGGCAWLHAAAPSTIFTGRTQRAAFLTRRCSHHCYRSCSASTIRTRY